jgi:hypothetical protein
MLVTLLLVIIRSVGQSVAACLPVVKCVKWSSFVAYRITLLCVCVYVFCTYIICVCVCVILLLCWLAINRGHQLKIVYAWLVRDLSVTRAQITEF